VPGDAVVGEGRVRSTSGGMAASSGWEEEEVVVVVEAGMKTEVDGSARSDVDTHARRDDGRRKKCGKWGAMAEERGQHQGGREV
jgi:hypothetical protein